MTFPMPPQAARALDLLRTAGHEAWIVGGCVRDHLLGTAPKDYDITTSALPEETKTVFQQFHVIETGIRHGTVTVVLEGEPLEITTYRVDGGYTDARHPDGVTFTRFLREDAARRDFTMNAMSYAPGEGLRDFFGGRDDVKAGIIRAVGDPAVRFQEDALRILRGIRFATRYGLSVEAETKRAMFALTPRMESLARERVFEELSHFLLCAHAEDLLAFAPVLAAAIPELQQTLGFEQHSPHHAYDVFTHTAHVTGAVPPVLPLRWAALLHDVGKPATFTLDETGCGHFYSHAKISADMADAVLRRFKAPTQLRENVVLLIGLHMTKLEPEKRLLRRRLSRMGTETLEQLLQLQEADMGSKGTGMPAEMQQFPQLRALLSEIYAEDSCLNLKDLAVDGNDLKALGLTGRKIGETLNHLLEQVLDEKLPNDRTALLAHVRNYD